MDAQRDIAMAEEIARRVAAAGGRTFYVGGLVRDRLLGRESKDVDIEVHGVTPSALEGILDSLGERTVMGASFGIYGLRHCGLDIAMPRRETATGGGHRDFDVLVDPFLGTQGAARRRDFTMNALMQDVLTGEIIDHFGGAEDLRRGRIRHVDGRTFVEDPLRVLRAAQMAARFGFEIDPSTRALSSRMDLRPLARERVMEEARKALLGAPMPSVFFVELARMGQLEPWFTELGQLAAGGLEACLRALDRAAGRRDRAAYPLGFVFAALCCGLGEDSAGTLLARLTGEQRLTRYVLGMTALRALPDDLDAAGADAGEFGLMLDRSPDAGDLILLTGCRRSDAEADARLAARLDVYRRRAAAPGVTGSDLAAAGFRPGPRFGQALEFARRLQLQGVEKDEALPRTLRYLGGLS